MWLPQDVYQKTKADQKSQVAASYAVLGSSARATRAAAAVAAASAAENENENEDEDNEEEEPVSATQLRSAKKRTFSRTVVTPGENERRIPCLNCVKSLVSSSSDGRYV